jgi:hypothetical protein
MCSFSIAIYLDWSEFILWSYRRASITALDGASCRTFYFMAFKYAVPNRSINIMSSKHTNNAKLSDHFLPVVGPHILITLIHILPNLVNSLILRDFGIHSQLHIDLRIDLHGNPLFPLSHLTSRQYNLPSDLIGHELIGHRKG